MSKSKLVCHEPKVYIKWVMQEIEKHLELFESHIHACDSAITASCLYVRDVAGDWSFTWDIY